MREEIWRAKVYYSDKSVRIAMAKTEQVADKWAQSVIESAHRAESAGAATVGQPTGYCVEIWWGRSWLDTTDELKSQQ